jgi:hypothetical protein
MSEETQRDSAGNAARLAPTAVDASAPGSALPSHLSQNGPDQRRIESWPIEGLKQHHRQATTFHELDGAEFDDLVASLAREGLREPIEVTPDGMIIDGHQRKRAAVRLGWTEVTVRVRNDLAGDRTAIDLAHLRANKTRRQLDGLDKVRVTRREMELERGRTWAEFSAPEQEQLRDLLGKNYGYSSRHAQRLINILTAPMAVQQAVSRGLLPVVEADGVSRLGWTKQLQIAREIEAGGDPAEIVAPYLAARKRPARPDDAFERLMAAVERGLDGLEGSEDQIRPSISDIGAVLRILERFKHFSETLAPILTHRFEEYERDRRKVMAELGLGDNADEFDAAVA